ncbi:MAG: peptidoglycan editing factor PgeF [Sutterellaceae bacterium]|nr:peptidoglycan editing factor PgeF [Burkholderiaceae bacterium]MDW8430417.1 peptidoglycan editing factor PgeF [Sutterellaceae bacterium]
MTPHPDWIVPALPVPGVRALITTRAGGVSRGPWGAGEDGGMNLGMGSGDRPEDVQANRARLRALLPAEPRWLRQVHGAAVVDAERVLQPPEADAAVCATPGVVCVVLVADCVPVILADAAGRGVAVAHAGWRGLATGVIQNAVQALRRRLRDPAARLYAFLGPAIGQQHFEVGEEVLRAMRHRLPGAGDAFESCGGHKYRADLVQLARMALAQVNVDWIAGGQWCTYSDRHRFYSYRRDRITGRHAALVWIDPSA